MTTGKVIDAEAKAALLAGMRVVIGSVAAATTEVGDMERRAEELLRQAQNLADEFKHLVGRAHGLSNRFIRLHEDAMQLVDEATGVTHDD